MIERAKLAKLALTLAIAVLVAIALGVLAFVQPTALEALYQPGRLAVRWGAVAALVVLLYLNRVDMLVALIIIGREIAISALREWMAKVGQAKSVAVAFVGKLKTVSQMVAIPLLLYHERLFGLVDCHWLGTILINVAAVLTVVSMLYYLRRALPHAALRS